MIDTPVLDNCMMMMMMMMVMMMMDDDGDVDDDDDDDMLLGFFIGHIIHISLGCTVQKFVFDVLTLFHIGTDTVDQKSGPEEWQDCSDDHLDEF